LAGPNCLGLPSSRMSNRAAVTNNALPPKAAATAAPVATTGAGFCQTPWATGDKQGLICGKPVKPGMTACGVHSRGKKNAGVGAVTAAAAPGFTGFSQPPGPPVAAPPKPHLLMQPGANGLSQIIQHEVLHGMLVRANPQGGLQAIGVTDPATGQLVEITEAQKIALTANGIAFESSIAPQPQPQQYAPQPVAQPQPQQYAPQPVVPQPQQYAPQPVVPQPQQYAPQPVAQPGFQVPQQYQTYQPAPAPVQQYQGPAPGVIPTAFPRPGAMPQMPPVTGVPEGAFTPNVEDEGDD
jgi:hypothetical protein